MGRQAGRHASACAGTFEQLSDFADVVLQVLADGGKQVVVGVQVRDDLVAIVEMVGTMVVHVVHGRLQGKRKGGKAT